MGYRELIEDLESFLDVHSDDVKSIRVTQELKHPDGRKTFSITVTTSDNDTTNLQYVTQLETSWFAPGAAETNETDWMGL